MLKSSLNASIFLFMFNRNKPKSAKVVLLFVQAACHTLVSLRDPVTGKSPAVDPQPGGEGDHSWREVKGTKADKVRRYLQQNPTEQNQLGNAQQQLLQDLKGVMVKEQTRIRSGKSETRWVFKLVGNRYLLGEHQADQEYKPKQPVAFTSDNLQLALQAKKKNLAKKEETQKLAAKELARERLDSL